MPKIKINKKILIFSIQDRDLFTTLPSSNPKRSCLPYTGRTHAARGTERERGTVQTEKEREEE